MPSTEPDASITLPDYSDYLHVVAAVIDDGAERILIAKRDAHRHQGGLWEYPGGKVERGEGLTDALKRELGEELGIRPVEYQPLIRVPHCYPDRKVLLDVWRVSAYSGQPRGIEGQQIAWVPRGKLSDYDFPEANRAITMAAQLPSHYLITPDPGPSESWPDFLRALQSSLDAGIELLQLRATTLDSDHYLALAREVVALCRRAGARVLLNAAPSLLTECEADGIHLNANRLMGLEKRPVARGRLLAASCHNLKELSHAERLGVDFAMLSPVKATASHPHAEARGWHWFHCHTERASIPLYALGGMELDDMEIARQHGAQGVAGIRALWKQGG